jgi:hypothetical protein
VTAATKTAEESMMVTAGQAYLEAAKWIVTHPESPGEAYMLLPFHTLLGLSLEMLLKTVGRDCRQAILQEDRIGIIW